MTMPRCVLPGKTYLITRRSIQRQFLLTPDDIVNDCLFFCLARSAEKYDIEVHAATFLSNHFHLVVTDTRAKLPKFMQWLCEYSAKCTNAYRGRWGALFEPESYSAVDLIERDDVLDKLAYTFMNPVLSGLVRWGYQWPGFRNNPELIGLREYVVRRPRVYFSARGSIPREAKLTFVKPKQFRHMSDEEFRTALCAKCRALERSTQERFDREGRKFLGRRKILAQDPTESATTWEAKRGLNPRIAARRKWPRIAAINDLQSFRQRYSEALARYKAGEHDVVFPPGTYWMRVHLGVQCQPPPK